MSNMYWDNAGSVKSIREDCSRRFKYRLRITLFQYTRLEFFGPLYKVTIWSIWSVFNTKCRRFSHVTKSHIFKNINLRKKADRNFRRTFLKHRYRHLKFYWNPPSWLARCRCHMDTLWKTKDWTSHFWEAQPFRIWYVEFHHQEDLNGQRQVFLLNFRPWPAQKPNNWSISYG